MALPHCVQFGIVLGIKSLPQMAYSANMWLLAVKACARAVSWLGQALHTVAPTHPPSLEATGRLFSGPP